MPGAAARSGWDNLLHWARVRGAPWIVAGLVAAGLGAIMLARALPPGAAPVVASARPVATPAGAAAGACAAAEAFYGNTAVDPGLLAASTAPYFEVSLNGHVFGPGPGTPVPWSAVAAWAATHPEIRLLGCIPSDGGQFAALRARHGFAYVLLDPSGAMSKLYLSPEPLPWD
jgi:hypothetical protein